MKLPVTVARRALGRATLLAALLCGGNELPAQTLMVSGNPATMKIQTAVPGFAPTSKTDASTSLTVSTPTGNKKKVIAQLNAPMPAGVTLTLSLPTPPGGGTTVGAVTLDATARTLITNFRRVVFTTPLTYQLSATLAAGVVPVQSRTVTFTITTAP